jgi:hypothetical protein
MSNAEAIRQVAGKHDKKKRGARESASVQEQAQRRRGEHAAAQAHYDEVLASVKDHIQAPTISRRPHIRRLFNQAF